MLRKDEMNQRHEMEVSELKEKVLYNTYTQHVPTTLRCPVSMMYPH
jgi:hypothetical protein